MPPEPRGETISYGPRRVPGPRDMGCQEAGAIVPDLIERSVRSRRESISAVEHRRLHTGVVIAQQILEALDEIVTFSPSIGVARSVGITLRPSDLEQAARTG